jgi:hypothetical protein
MTLRPLGRGTSSYTSRLLRASNSWRQALYHSFCSDCGNRAISFNPHDLGSVVTSAIGGIALVMRNERSFTPPSLHASSASESLFPRPFSMSSSDSVGEIGGRGTDSSLCGDLVRWESIVMVRGCSLVGNPG